MLLATEALVRAIESRQKYKADALKLIEEAILKASKEGSYECFIKLRLNQDMKNELQALGYLYTEVEKGTYIGWNK